MLKTSTIAACVLALSGSVALAQMMPVGPNSAPGGAGGSAPANTIGSPSANGLSRSDYSSSAQMQYGTQPQQAQGSGMMAGPSGNPRAVAITDEYGNQYNSRGDKIGRGRPARMR
jgi:hypothetical protein